MLSYDAEHMSGKKQHSMKGSITVILAIFAVLIIAALIALLYLSNASSQTYSPQLPAFPHTNSTIPTSVPILNQSGQQTSLQIAALTQNSLSNDSEFSISYNGTLYLKPSGLVGAVATINSPIHVKEERYYNELKFAANATSLPILGTGNLYFLSITNGTYSCSNFNTTAIASRNYGKIFLGSNNVSCIKSASLAGINLTQIASFNLSAFEQEGLQFNYTKRYQSVYDGMPCTVLSGSLSQPNTTNVSINSGAFEMCLSDKYYVPLSFYMFFKNSHATGYISLNETTISNQSSKSYIESMPGSVS